MSIELLNEVLEEKEVEYNANELAYQLTAYETWGCIDYEKGLCDLIISEYIENADESDLLYEWNEYCMDHNYCDDMIYDMAEFNEMFSSYEPEEIANRIHFGDYNPFHDYFTFNGYGNVQTLELYDVKNIVKNSDINDYLLEKYFSELLEDDFKNEIIKMALELVKAGY